MVINSFPDVCQECVETVGNVFFVIGFNSSFCLLWFGCLFSTSRSICHVRLTLLTFIYNMSVKYLDLANLFNLLNILQKYLYFYILFSVGFLIFVRINFDLLIDEFSSPCVIHGSRFIYLRINLILFVGRATLNALSYTHMNLL